MVVLQAQDPLSGVNGGCRSHTLDRRRDCHLEVGHTAKSSDSAVVAEALEEMVCCCSIYRSSVGTDDAPWVVVSQAQAAAMVHIHPRLGVLHPYAYTLFSYDASSIAR
jgi:hypothetical protein